VEVPTAAGTGEGWVGDARAIFYQFHGITHGKRMVNGHLSRAPVMHFWHMRTDHPTLSWLGQRRDLEPGRVAAQLREMVYDWPIGYIVIHQDLIGRDTATNEEIIGFFNTLDDLLCPVFVEGVQGEAVVYRSAWHPDGCPPRIPVETAPGVYHVDLGAPEDVRHIGWGWHRPEEVAGLAVRWAGEYPQAEIYVDLPPGEYSLAITAQSFLEPRTVTVLLDGVMLGTAEIDPDTLATHSFTVPSEVIDDGEHLRLTLDYDGWIVPAESGHSGDPRRLALMVERIEFVRAGEP
jgi:hypothetical protein